MLYCTYDQYQTAGGTLDEAAFTPLCFRASKLIDRATFGRAEAHTKGCADCAEALAMACASIVQSLERAEAARAATGYAPGVTSVTSTLPSPLLRSTVWRSSPVPRSSS